MDIARATEVTVDSVPESRTRERVLRAISQQGPITTTSLATALGLSDTAIRRHVDNLAEAGLIETHESLSPRRRGRPAKSFVLSEAGHRSLTSDTDHLANQALRYLAEALGQEAVEDFARTRIADWERRYAAMLDPHADPAQRAQALVAALTKDGFDASLREIGEPGMPGARQGLQLCQGHCPVQGVAAKFPQLCEAETEAFSRLLGVHVQRLATLAHGDHVCTTYIPTTTLNPTEAS